MAFRHRFSSIPEFFQKEQPLTAWSFYWSLWLYPLFIGIISPNTPVIFFFTPIAAVIWGGLLLFNYRRKKLNQELINKIGMVESAFIFFPILFAGFAFKVTVIVGVLDAEDPSIIGAGILLFVAYFIGYTPLEQFRNRIIKNREGIAAGLDALNLVSYISNLVLIFVIPLVLGVIGYAVAFISFKFSHTISYFFGLGIAAPAYYVAFQML